MSTETQRAEFEAWFRREHPDWVGQLDRTYAADGGYMYEARRLWRAWQAAQAPQAAELAALKADIAEHVRITAEQATEIEVLRNVSDEYNAWIRFQAAGHDYDEFLRQRLVCVDCKSYRDATGERVLPICRCKAAIQTKEAS
jgi:hypothetical protein